MFANRHHFTLSAVLWAALWAVAAPAFSKGPFVGVEFGPLNGSHERVRTEAVPEKTWGDTGGEIFRAVRLGYMFDSRWFIAVQKTIPDDYSSKASGFVNSGPGNTGDVRTEELAASRFSDSVHDFTLGKRFDVLSDIAIDVEFGLVKWESRNTTKRTLLEYPYVAPDKLGPAIVLSSSNEYWSEDGVDGVLGFSVEVHNEVVMARLSLRHYGGIGATTIGFGVTVGF